METNYKQKIYAFYVNCEYHLITRFSENKYGIVPLFTDSYGIEECESWTLGEALQLCKNNNWKVQEFDTYKEFFVWCLKQEESLDFLDFWSVKNLTGRHFYIEDKGDQIRNLRDNDEKYKDYRVEIPFID